MIVIGSDLDVPSAAAQPPQNLSRAIKGPRRMQVRMPSDPTPFAETKPITVLSAAHHPILQRGIASLLKEDQGIELVAQVANGDDAVAIIRRRRPDVALLALSMPGKGALEVLEELCDTKIATRFVILARHISEPDFLRGVRLGARGMFLKDMPAQLLARCIRTVHGGDYFLERDALHRAFRKILGNLEQGGGMLTERETATVKLVVGGMSNKQIARSLSISEGTVKVHLHRAYEKLGVRGRMGLVVYARREGLL